MLFFIFFEATLIPLFVLISTWGHANRTYAAIKFFFISFAGSLLVLAAMLYLFGVTHTFDMAVWQKAHLGFMQQLLVFLGFFAAFAVKVPMGRCIPGCRTFAPTARPVPPTTWHP